MRPERRSRPGRARRTPEAFDEEFYAHHLEPQTRASGGLPNERSNAVSASFTL